MPTEVMLKVLGFCLLLISVVVCPIIYVWNREAGVLLVVAQLFIGWVGVVIAWKSKAIGDALDKRH